MQLSVIGRTSEVVTLAYGSTKATHATRGAECVRIDPAATHDHTGFALPTYVYSSRLVSFPLPALPFAAGRLIDGLPALRASLSRALGLGSGVTTDPNTRGSNRRGRVVELTAAIAQEWGVGHAVVVTEPRYSRWGYLQTVVPLLDGDHEREELDVLLPDERWLAQLGVLHAPAILATTLISTVYAADHIASYLPVVISAECLTELEHALRLHFGLATT